MLLLCVDSTSLWCDTSCSNIWSMLVINMQRHSDSSQHSHFSPVWFIGHRLHGGCTFDRVVKSLTQSALIWLGLQSNPWLECDTSPWLVSLKDYSFCEDTLESPAKTCNSFFSVSVLEWWSDFFVVSWCLKVLVTWILCIFSPRHSLLWNTLLVPLSSWICLSFSFCLSFSGSLRFRTKPSVRARHQSSTSNRATTGWRGWVSVCLSVCLTQTVLGRRCYTWRTLSTRWFSFSRKQSTPFVIYVSVIPYVKRCNYLTSRVELWLRLVFI